METRPAGEQEPTREKLDEPLREEDVTTADRLDDRVSEGEGLPDGNDQGEK